MVRRIACILIFLMTAFNLFAQELNCNFVVNAQQTGNENVQVFKTLENNCQSL